MYLLKDIGLLKANLKIKKWFLVVTTAGLSEKIEFPPLLSLLGSERYIYKCHLLSLAEIICSIF
jgi:hypothetical protein